MFHQSNSLKQNGKLVLVEAVALVCGQVTVHDR